jgi:hypothetical protein
METITADVNGKMIQMVIISKHECSEASANILVGNGFEPVMYTAKRPNGKKQHVLYRSARWGSYVSIVSQ